MKHFSKQFDLIVVGGGHAGIEAAVIAANKQKRVALVSLDLGAIGRMSCNPAIGGLAKGQIVREIDVLGGLMGKITDQSGIQFKILNKSKGKSVWSPRAQVDKRRYEKTVSSLVLNHSHITIVEGEAIDVLITNYRATGVVLRGGQKILSLAVLLTCGTFLNGLIHIGQKKDSSRANGRKWRRGDYRGSFLKGFSSG